MMVHKIYKTDYFAQPWTWIKRAGIFIVFIILVTGREVAEDPWDYWWLKYVIFIFLSVGLFLSPVDDIMIDDRLKTEPYRSVSFGPGLKQRNELFTPLHIIIFLSASVICSTN
jgi:hypothetical protein